MPETDSDALFLVGRITQPHGVRGEMKVRPETDDPERFGLFDRLFIGPDARTAARREQDVQSIRFQQMKNGTTAVLLTLKTVTSREDAGDLRNQNVYAHEDDLPPLADGEVFVHDLIGMTVVIVDEDDEPTGETIGTVRDVFESGASFLYSVTRDGQPDLLIPDVEPIVRSVDGEAREIRVFPPDGLLDL
ncbi:ribosome maturation factor RimM [Rubricoccus marinus]|uniref:Ribosome maturation factor RimM n=1 Tax=Rubricoccus marinus TaxID=716817 RepID=A0A259TZP7_9BACT|nr:ribosome maturation factor RimM [Rubricoccus marinus]OZC03170.1 16S rRNA processing protein RimM [Rubricoccus marinus]